MARGGSAHADSKRSNVLFILTDDQREDTVGALGNPHIRTPHLDELARGGVVFSNAYCMGGFSGAVCLPSRMMVLRGRSWFSVRDLPPGFGNLPSSMKSAGYQTFHVGKMGNTDTEVQALFEESHYVKPKQHKGPLPENCDELVRREGLPGEHVADSAIDFLGRRDKSRPFFMYVAGPEPHDPRVAPKEYLDLYDVDKIPLPPNFLPRHPFDNGELEIRDEQLAAWPRTEREIRQHLRDYYAVITYMDGQFGRIFKALKDCGEYENTIILFSSDQGIAIGSHGLMGKQNLYEHSMGVPLIFSGPQIPRGKRVDAFAYLFDVFPTLCELVGAPAPAGIEGKSLAPVIRGEQDSVRNTIFLAYRDVQRAVRVGPWKLIRYPKVNKTQLFNLDIDP
ncbi:MAG: sulfatase-like hydrolase/transferase, partial [Candidatus Hydrogenedentes bacterium]|nr:sulfatase-like hydrolase/transferase [Candidatus Hydrogenedentota bacterium]